MITRVCVKNFRSLADVDVTLGPLTVLVGRNGAGKSAFVDVLRFVRDALRSGLDIAISERHGIHSLRRWTQRRKPEIEISLVTASINFWGEYSFTLRSEQSGEYRVEQETCRAGIGSSAIRIEFQIADGKWKIYPEGLLSSELRNGLVHAPSLMLPLVSTLSDDLNRLYSSLTDTNFYLIFPNMLREPQKPGRDSPLSDDGSNMASILRKMKRQSRQFPDLLASLNRVVEDVSDVRVRQIGGYFVTEIEHLAQNNHSFWLELAQESDGTLQALALLTALYQESKRRLIAIEEPELTLHPGALGILSDVLRETSLRRQVLITTQSPDLISRFDANELRVVERVEGITKIGPIDETQREVINEQLFSAGDLLRIEGLHRSQPEPVGADNG